jgi:hypothetical protein
MAFFQLQHGISVYEMSLGGRIKLLQENIKLLQHETMYSFTICFFSLQTYNIPRNSERSHCGLCQFEVE